MRYTFMMAGLLVGGCAAIAVENELSLDEPDSPRPIAEPVVPRSVEPQPAGSRSEEPPTCVGDVLGDAALRLRNALGDEEAQWMGGIQVASIGDLDGDEEPDIVVVATEQCGVSGNCPQSIYLSQNGCWTHGGTSWWAHMNVRPSERLGVRDLALYVKGGCAGLEGTISRFEWSGRHYELVEQIECGCVDEAPDPARDPSCPE
jgi:hypothetical protein